MINVKTFRIRGKYKKGRREHFITRYIRALDEDKALEKFCSLIGGEKLKRLQVEIVEIKEVTYEDIRNLKLKRLIIAENPVLWVD